MRLEKIDHLLLAALVATLLFAVFKVLLAQGVILLPGATSQSFPPARGKQVSDEPVMTQPQVLEQSIRQQQLMQLEQQSHVTPDSQIASEGDKAPSAELQAASTEKITAPGSNVSEGPKYFQQVYSMQVGVFKTVDEVVAFARRNSGVSLYCRKKDNGYWGSYYGTYDSYSRAKSHLQDDALLERVGAYVVKLSDTSFMPCLSLREAAI